jgi:hypothetical protein
VVFIVLWFDSCAPILRKNFGDFKTRRKNMAKKKREIKLKVQVNKEKAGKEKKIGLKETTDGFKISEADTETKKNFFPDQKEKEERDKRIMMAAGVSFFMILFITLWVANIKNVFKQVEEGQKNSKQFEWNKISDDFSQTISQIKEGISELKQAALVDSVSTSTANEINYLPENENASTTEAFLGEVEEEQDNILELKERLKNLEDSMDNKN